MQLTVQHGSPESSPIGSRGATLLEELLAHGRMPALQNLLALNREIRHPQIAITPQEVGIVAAQLEQVLHRQSDVGELPQGNLAKQEKINRE